MGIDATMIVVINRKITEDERRRWSYLFGSAFADKLWIGYDEKIRNKPLDYPKNYRNSNPNPHVYEQDGDDFVISKEHTMLEVPLSSRYYGKGYERGPLFNYIAMAEFLEFLIPECRVYYGGDSSGVCLELFDKSAREDLIKHFIKNNGRNNYLRAFDADKNKNTPDCPVCEVNMFRNGWGNNYSLYTCAGCGWMISTKDGITKAGFEFKE